MNKKILLCQGGLGDHLSLSTLPEEFTKKGYEVYLSVYNIHRNSEIYDLVWGINPFIKGFSNESANCGHVFNINYDNDNFITCIENSNNIYDTGNLIPKLYRSHNLIEELRDKTILNLESITANYTEVEVIEKVNRIILENNINKEDILVIKSIKNNNVNGNSFLVKKDIKLIETEYPVYYINDIYHYCDILNSCKNYITLHSGGASLAATIRNNNTWVIMNESLRESMFKKSFIYNNQNYIF